MLPLANHPRLVVLPPEEVLHLPWVLRVIQDVPDRARIPLAAAPCRDALRVHPAGSQRAERVADICKALVTRGVSAAPRAGVRCGHDLDTGGRVGKTAGAETTDSGPNSEADVASRRGVVRSAVLRQGDEIRIGTCVMTVQRLVPA